VAHTNEGNNVYPQTSKMFLTPLKPGLESLVLMPKVEPHRLSFAYQSVSEFKDLQMPLLLPKNRVDRAPPTDKEELLLDFEFTEANEFVMINKAVLKRQEGIYSELLKKLFSSVFSGKGLKGVSLPIRLCEPRSGLSRILDNFVYVPTLLKKANSTKDMVERAKLCLTCIISGLCMSPSNYKPFNPFLGETLEAEFSDGSQICLEQTSHHPPIANFLITTVYGVRAWGRYEQVADFSTNKVDLFYRGPYNVQFADGHTITMFLPSGQQTGLIVGKRTLKFHQKACYYDPANGLKGFLEFGTHPKEGKWKGKRSDVVQGEVYRFNPAKHAGFGKDYKAVGEAFGFKTKDRVEVLASGEGSILESLDWDGKEYWNFEEFAAFRGIPIENPLPSDYRFREDLIWLEYGEMDQAQKWKTELEEVQRRDRKLREKKLKEHKKH
jgi:hypothetical protein